MSSQVVVDPGGIGDRAEFAAALTVLRETAGLTVRELARRADAPAATVGGYLSGRHIPSPAAHGVVRAMLTACGVAEADQGPWLAALRRARAASDGRGHRALARHPLGGDGRAGAAPFSPYSPYSPYKGLASFEPDDAELFFGRDEATGRLLDRLVALRAEPGPTGGVLAVVGPSGSGKSSVLRAGLVAAIRAGRLDSDAHLWRVELSTPSGGLPASDAADGHGTDQPRMARGPNDEGARDESPDEASPGEPRPGDGSPREVGVLVVDQAEELFTSFDERARARFLTGIDRARWPLVVFGLRADFYADAAREPALLPALAHAQVLIGPLDEAATRAVITGPATAVGLGVDDALVELLLADLAPHGATEHAHDHGALPLLSHALRATWERSSGGRLTVGDYLDTGGLDAAVQRTAEQLWIGLDPARQELVRRIFLRLVHVDDEIAVTRRRIVLGELADVAESREIDTVLMAFVEQRLLTVGDGWLEISHEALLSAWPRLRAWVDSDRDGLRVHRAITYGANEWARSGADAALLPRGGQLEAAAAWADGPDHHAAMNDVERRFVAAARAQQTGERRTARLRARRFRQLFAVVAVLAVVGIVLAGTALASRSTAERERRSANAARDDALSRSTAFRALQLQQDDPALAEQLALAAMRIARTPEALAALTDISADPLVTRVLGVPGPTALAVSPDGHVIAVGHADDGSVHLFTVASGLPPHPAGRLPGTPGSSGNQVFALAFTPDGRTLITGGEAPTVDVWDVADPQRPNRVAALRTGFSGAVQTLAVSPDGLQLLAGSAGPHPVLRWSLADPDRPQALTPPVVSADTTVQGLAFDSAGDRLAAGGSAGTDAREGVLLTWAVRGNGFGPATVRDTPSGATVDAVRYDPTGRYLFAGDRLGSVTVWAGSGSARRPVHVLHGDTDSQVNVLAVSRDGATLAVGSSDDSLRQWNVPAWTTYSVTDNPGPVTGAAYDPDGRLVSAAADGTLRLMAQHQRQLPLPGSTFAVQYSRDGRRLIACNTGPGSGVQMWDVADPDASKRLGPLLRMPASTASVDGTGSIRPDGQVVAAGNSAGQVELWDVRDPQHPRRLVAPFDALSATLVETVQFSPDGRLLAVGGDNGTVQLIDVSTPSHPRLLGAVHPGNIVLNVAFSPDGRQLAAADTDASGYLYDVHDPARPVPLARLTGFRSYVYGVGFAPDGHEVALASSDHTVRLYDTRDPRRPRRLGRPLIGPTDYVYAVSFSPDGRLVAAASNDRTVRLYRADGSDPEPLETLRSADSNVFAVSYSPDGRTLAAGGRSGGITLWSTDTGRIARDVCRVAGDPIDRQEWALYVPGRAYQPPCR